MNAGDLQSLQTWFFDYCRSFSTPKAEEQRNLDLKVEHTRRVSLNAARIGEELKLTEADLLLTQAVALFHDVGRFPQYRKYRTFNDGISTNHAALGAKTLLENGVLRVLPERERNIILDSVTLHNVFSLPEQLDRETRLFCKLVRDADKLDILRVMTEYFEQDEGERAEAVTLGLPDLPEYSGEVLAALSRGEMARKDRLTTLNDFKLLQLAWMYDLNFSVSLRMVQEGAFVQKIAGSLPRTHDISRVVQQVNRYVEERSGG